MQRYFFVIRCPDQEENDDECGTRLPSEVAARGLAEQIIRELKEAGGYDDPGFIMVVKDTRRKTIFSIPFLRPLRIIQ
jgi:hypothetical protein